MSGALHFHEPPDPGTNFRPAVLANLGCASAWHSGPSLSSGCAQKGSEECDTATNAEQHELAHCAVLLRPESVALEQAVKGWMQVGSSRVNASSDLRTVSRRGSIVDRRNMNEALPVAKMFCPSCGQRLSVPTRDLSLLYECPRCHDVRAASELVSKRNTVPAVPAADAIAYETAIEPLRVVSERIPPTMREPDLVPPTARMPNAPGRVAPPALRLAASPPGVTPPAPPGIPVAAPAWQPAPLNPPPAPAPQPVFVPVAQAAIPVPPPPPPALPNTPPRPVHQPGFETRAREGFVAGTVAAGRSASFVLHCAARTDRFLQGKRATAVASVAVLVLAAPLIDQAFGCGVVSVVSLVLFVVLLVLLGLARIDAFRDDSGFRAALVGRTISEAIGSLLDWGKRLWSAPPGQKGIDGAKPLLFGGLIASASASLAAAVGADDIVVSWMQWSGGTALTVGVLGSAWGWWMLRRRTAGTGLTVHATNANVVNQAVQAMPLVVDCRDEASLNEVAQRVDHPLVRALLVELGKPWPRPHYDDERECQDRLAKRLRLAMPEANPRTERWIGERQRADLLLGDDKAGVLIELKARANSTTIDRLIGQAWKYLDVWKDRGPMLLIVCRTDPQDAAPRLQREIERMRREGHAVLAVFAMP